MYAQIAVNAAVEGAFDYHIPPELENKLAPGHLVQIPFGTAMQHGIVLSLSDESSVPRTKPVVARLDPEPVLTSAQIDLARWMSHTYLAPIGLCLWLLLPPGISGGRDWLVTLLDPDAEPADELEGELLALLRRRRGVLRGRQINLALPGKPWRGAVEALAKAGVLQRENILTAPRVRPKTVQTVTLAIQPEEIEDAVQPLARPSRAADLLAAVAEFNGTLLQTRKTKPVAEKLAAEGLIQINEDGTLSLAVAPETIRARVLQMRKLEKPLRILRLLARDRETMDLNWVYVQADATLNDLRRLEEEGLVILGEKNAWRDSLAQRDFVPTQPPTLTPEQAAVWTPILEAIEGKKTTDLPNDSRENSQQKTRGREQKDAHLAKTIDTLAREKRVAPTLAENLLWQHLRHLVNDSVQIQRQHAIDRFVVDFYCPQAALVIEVDGEYQQYTEEETAMRQAFIESLGLTVLRFTNDEVLRSVSSVIERVQAAFNNAAQAAPVQKDQEELRENEGEGVAFLLHGVTGSGKTEIYLRAIEKTLERGRSAIFLVPEIALTPQTIRRVAARFPGQVAVVHSALSMGERYDTWRRARDGNIRVVVGARSALFTPLQNLGLIVLDEEHDSSYKQSPPIAAPYYHARQVAEEMMRRNGGIVILGSATPDLETMYRARRGEIKLLHMPNRIMGHRARIHEQADREGVVARYAPGSTDDVLMIDLPPVQMVDMRHELKGGNTSIFSRALQNALAQTLKRGEQTILFINRRGQSTYVFCRDCGYIAACPRCDSPLTHHRQGQALRCHRCGYEQPEPQVCPQCRSTRIKFFGAGTQQVEQALHELFPRARTVRWDADTASTPEAHETILQRFVDRKADILVGTQMVAKGLDLPLVTLVGVVSADLGLALPDFRATERTFQVLTQVAGRAGRGLLGGQVILQTYQPGHYAVATAAGHDYGRFYERELAYRRDLGYPPFRRLARIIFRFNTEDKARSEAERAATLLRKRIQSLNLTGTELIGPAPCFFTRINKAYRWHLLLRGPDPTIALRAIEIGKGWFVDVDPVEVL